MNKSQYLKSYNNPKRIIKMHIKEHEMSICSQLKQIEKLKKDLLKPDPVLIAFDNIKIDNLNYYYNNMFYSSKLDKSKANLEFCFNRSFPYFKMWKYFPVKINGKTKKFKVYYGTVKGEVKHFHLIKKRTLQEINFKFLSEKQNKEIKNKVIKWLTENKLKIVIKDKYIKSMLLFG